MATVPASMSRAGARAGAADRLASENRLAAYNVLVAMLALVVGGSMGLLQVLEYNGIDLYPYLTPVLKGYYHGLSLHGVLNVLVWTTFYIMGFLTFVTAHSFNRPFASRQLAWGSFWLQIVGLLMAAVPLIGNMATVLFTFYPPLQANAFFYIGLTLVVVGTWGLLLNQVLTYRAWRAENPTARTPLPAFMAMVTMMMWTLATVGIAAEMLFMIIPWSLGLIKGIDPVLARTLFWFTGHPIVYFWLLPAYISWYTMVPKQAGGKLFSEPMARVSFLLFLILSVPIGLHHQVTDPGVSEYWKLFHAILTFMVFFPSLLTFFNVVASLEHGGRKRGGTGWLGWIFKLPWNEASFTTQVLAMLLFAFGGASGLINASYTVNLVVHNTAWVPGHFHLTVGSAVTLTFFGISYWLVPYLTGKALYSNTMGLAQGWSWFVGMALFSHYMHTLGLLNMPRRTMIGATPYLLPEWKTYLPIVMVGGILMTISGFLFFFNMLMTVVASKSKEGQQIPWASAISGTEDVPNLLDTFRPWLIIAVVLVLISYGPVLFAQISTTPMNIPGMRPW